MVVAIGILLGLVIVGCVLAISIVPDTLRMQRENEKLEKEIRDRRNGDC